VNFKTLVILGFILLAGTALAQQADINKAPVIGVALESSDGRIQNWAPGLREHAARVVEKMAKNARVIIIGVTGKDVAGVARKNGVDYLMTIELSPRPYGSISFGATPQIAEQQAPTLGAKEQTEAQGTIYLSWTVQALNGKAFKLHDSRLVRAQEYPLGPELDWLHAIADRSVQDAAYAAMGKLKKKAGI
jgi:hypothetical protein